MESKWLSKAHRYYHPNDWTINSNRKKMKNGSPSLSFCLLSLPLSLLLSLPPFSIHPSPHSLLPYVSLSLPSLSNHEYNETE